eukprot:COSAG02_NODE_6446_length_3564_cov_2.147475_1_plen_354_part_00
MGMKLGDVGADADVDAVAAQVGTENPVALAQDAGGERQLHLRGLNRQYESEAELEQAFHKAYAGVEVERVEVFVEHDTNTMENTSWAVVTMRTEQDAQVVLEKPHRLPGKITITRTGAAALQGIRSVTDVVLVGGATSLRRSTVGEYKLSKLHGQAGWSQARKDIPLHLWDRPEHGDKFTFKDQLLKWPSMVLRVIVLPAFLGQLPFTISLAGEQQRCVIPGHHVNERGSEVYLTIPCANVHKWAFVYFTCPLWLLGAIFFLLQLYKIQLTDIGFGAWQHYAIIIGCCQITFLIGEELIWEQFQPTQIVTVTLAHMTAILMTTWPLFFIAFYLVANFDAEAQAVQEAHGGEWS